MQSRNAEIAQLVERNLAKVEVAGPSPVFRSKAKRQPKGCLFRFEMPSSRPATSTVPLFFVLTPLRLGGVRTKKTLLTGSVSNVRVDFSQLTCAGRAYACLVPHRKVVAVATLCKNCLLTRVTAQGRPKLRGPCAITPPRKPILHKVGCNCSFHLTGMSGSMGPAAH